MSNVLGFETLLHDSLINDDITLTGSLRYELVPEDRSTGTPPELTFYDIRILKINYEEIKDNQTQLSLGQLYRQYINTQAIVQMIQEQNPHIQFEFLADRFYY